MLPLLRHLARAGEFVFAGMAYGFSIELWAWFGRPLSLTVNPQGVLV